MPPVARLFLQSLPSVFSARRGSFLCRFPSPLSPMKDGNLLDLRATIGHFLEYARSGTFLNTMENHTRERERAICCIAVSFNRKLIIFSLTWELRCQERKMCNKHLSLLTI